MGGNKLDLENHHDSIIVIADTNIIIDFMRTNKIILFLLTKYFKGVVIPEVVINELNDYSEKELRDLGMNILVSDVELLFQAANIENNIGDTDNVCMLEAIDNDYAIITNDRRMRNECLKHNVELFYGFQVMILLVKKGLLKRKEAIKTADQICKENKRFSKKVFQDFIEKL